MDAIIIPNNSTQFPFLLISPLPSIDFYICPVSPFHKVDEWTSVGLIIPLVSVHLWRWLGNSFLLDFLADSHLFIMDCPELLKQIASVTG